MLWADQDVAVTSTMVRPDGTPANPTSVRYRVLSPSNVETTYVLGTDDNVTAITAGHVYRLVFDASEAGTWTVRTEALDAASDVVGVTETRIVVSASRLS